MRGEEGIRVERHEGLEKVARAGGVLRQQVARRDTRQPQHRGLQADDDGERHVEGQRAEQGREEDRV